MAITYDVSDKSSRFLVPTGESNIDVTKMNWTVSPQSAREEVPSMYLTEYQQNVGQLINGAIYYLRAVAKIINGNHGLISGATDADIYKFRYFAEPTGFKYKIPFFSQRNKNKANIFGNDSGQSPFASLVGIKNSMGATNLFGRLEGYLSAGKQIAGALLPGDINLENPRSWESSGNPSIDITWDLFNTGTPEQLADNRNLAYILSYQNSPARRSAFIVDPPVIYDLFVPDVIHMPACFVNSLEILNLGNTRQRRVGNRELILPEAYRFKLSFTSLLMDTRNIMNGLDKGTKVSVIENDTLLFQLGEAIANGDKAAIDRLVPQVETQFGTPPGFLDRIIPGQTSNPGIVPFAPIGQSTNGNVVPFAPQPA